MATTYDEASLVLIPSGTKTSKVFSQKPVNGDGDFTFSRSTAATRVNADGVIEKETQNLLTKSNTLSAWSNSNTTETGGQSGYDGSNDAWLVTKSAANAFIGISATYSGVFTQSIYAKAGSLNWVALQNSGISQTLAWFDIQNGVTGFAQSVVISHSITDVGNGWYRCEATYNGTSSTFRVFPSVSDNNTSGTSGNIYIQDAQLEQGLVARDYIETTTAAVEKGITDNVPRLDYTDASCPSLLLEPQRTNIFAQSEYYNIYWSHTNSSVSNNQLESPEGFVNASVLSVVSSAQAGINVFNNWSDNTTYSMSAFVKKKIGSYIGFGVYGNAMGDEWIKWNLDNGTSTANDLWTNANFEDYGNGWYRISATITTTSGSTSKSGFKLNLMTQTSYTGGNVGDEAYIYGLQLEAGSYATSYIPTYGSAVTRNLDTATGNIQVTNTDNFSIYLEFDNLNKTDEGTGETAIQFPSTTAGYWGRVYPYYTNEALRWFLRGDGVSINIYHYYDPASTKIKTLITYDGSAYKVYANGSLKYTWNETGYTLHTGQSTAVKVMGLENFMTFNKALSNEEAIALTTI